MADKSYVTMSQKVCLVCTAKVNTNELLLDTRLRPIFERYTVTGWDLCPTHKQLHNDGYIAVVAIDEKKSWPREHQHTIKPEEAWRTGRIAMVKREAWAAFFNIPEPDAKQPMIFAEDDTLDMLERRYTEQVGEPPPDASPSETVVNATPKED